MQGAEAERDFPPAVVAPSIGGGDRLIGKPEPLITLFSRKVADWGDLHFGTIRINFAEANVKGSLGGPFFVTQRRVYGLGDRKNCRPNRISCRPKRDCRRP